MATPPAGVASRSDLNATIEDIRKNRTRFVVLGILLLLLGIVAVVFPFASTIAAKTIIGWLLIVTGVGQLFQAFSSEKLAKFVLGLIIGILFVLVGAWLAFFPLAGIITLTLVLAATFIVQGALEIGMAFRMRTVDSWMWMAVSGAVAIVAGLLLFAGLPSTAIWALGLLVGINLISSGTAYLMLALATRH